MDNACILHIGEAKVDSATLRERTAFTLAREVEFILKFLRQLSVNIGQRKETWGCPTSKYSSTLPVVTGLEGSEMTT